MHGAYMRVKYKICADTNARDVKSKNSIENCLDTDSFRLNSLLSCGSNQQNL